MSYRIVSYRVVLPSLSGFPGPCYDRVKTSFPAGQLRHFCCQVGSARREECVRLLRCPVTARESLRGTVIRLGVCLYLCSPLGRKLVVHLKDCRARLNARRSFRHECRAPVCLYSTRDVPVTLSEITCRTCKQNRNAEDIAVVLGKNVAGGLFHSVRTRDCLEPVLSDSARRANCHESLSPVVYGHRCKATDRRKRDSAVREGGQSIVELRCPLRCASTTMRRRLSCPLM